MLSILDIIYKGILIGILVSAPMGPIGLLCVQRTLNKGQWQGFFSGVGAALSDLFYAGIVCLGMGFVVDFIEGNQYILKIIGSVFFMFFGIYIFRTNPSKQLQKPKESSSNSVSQNIISAFFLTLSNPLIILFYIVLFSRFNFISPEEKLFSMLLGLLCIFAGALSWWFLITFFVGKLRKVINLRGLWLINKIVGTVIVVLSILGFIYPIKTFSM